MTPDRHQLEDDMLQFVQSRCPNHPDLTADTDLLDGNVLDSLLLMDLVFQIEDRYGIRLGSDEISPSNFRTTSAIVGLVAAQLDRRSPD